MKDENGAMTISVEATGENVEKVTDFVHSCLESTECSTKTLMQLDIAIEEIFVNIANYAYAPNVGDATVKVTLSKDPPSVTITFIDRGVPYDPLKRPDPDVTLSADERKIGGLGIFMTKKTMDRMEYEYKDGQNILTMEKILK